MDATILLFEIETAPASFFWGIFLILGAGSFFLVRLSPLFLLPVLAVIVFIFWVLTIDITDASFVPAIIKQEGYSYVVQAFAALLIGPIILSFLGLPAWYFRQKK